MRKGQDEYGVQGCAVGICIYAVQRDDSWSGGKGVTVWSEIGRECQTAMISNGFIGSVKLRYTTSAITAASVEVMSSEAKPLEIARYLLRRSCSAWSAMH